MEPFFRAGARNFGPAQPPMNGQKIGPKRAVFPEHGGWSRCAAEFQWGSDPPPLAPAGFARRPIFASRKNALFLLRPPPPLRTRRPPFSWIWERTARDRFFEIVSFLCRKSAGFGLYRSGAREGGREGASLVGVRGRPTGPVAMVGAARPPDSGAAGIPQRGPRRRGVGWKVAGPAGGQGQRAPAEASPRLLLARRPDRALRRGKTGRVPVRWSLSWRLRRKPSEVGGEFRGGCMD